MGDDPMQWRFVPASEFTSYGAKWQELNERYYGNHPILNSIFISCLLRHFGHPKVRLGLCSDQDELVGMALLEPYGLGRWRIWCPSQCVVGPMVMPRDAPTTSWLPGLFRALGRTAVFASFLHQDPLYTTLPCPGDGPMLQEVVPFGTTMAVDLAGAFDDYWESRPTKLRKNMRRYFRLAEKEVGGVTLCWANTQEGVRVGVGEYADLESLGWKAAINTALSRTNVQGRFYSALLERFSRDERAIVATLLDAEGQVIAARLVIGAGDQLVILKTTYEESQKRVAPGRVLLYLVLQRLFELFPGQRVEFYTRATSEQLYWATDQRGICHINVFAPGWKGRLVRKVQRRGATLRFCIDSKVE